MQTTVTNGEITTVFDVADFNVNIGEGAKIDVNEAVNYIKTGQVEVQQVVDAGTATFNANASAKTEAFNNNATAKTNAFNSNASSKTGDFNTNASDKTTAFDENATAKTNTFNQNATDKTTAFNNNAGEKTTAFNTNYTEKKAIIDEQVGIATTQAGIATAKATEASQSAASASNSATSAETYAEQAESSASEASTSATNAYASEVNAGQSASDASDSASTATTQAGIATSKAAEASSLATSASNSANSATTSATTATNQANLAKQYAIGEPSEPTEHSAKYWAEQAESELSGLSSRVTTIEGKIPSSASSSNQLTDKDYVDTQDNALQSQIDALVVSSDVFDIVGTYAELQAYDISIVPVNDIIKVLVDSTHSNAATYYRCVESGGVKSWSYIGSEGAYYTKAETNSLLDDKQDTLVSGTNIKTVNGNSLVGSGDVNISATATWGNITGTLSNQTDLNNALNAKANDSDVVHNKGWETITGKKTFTASPTILGDTQSGSLEGGEIDFGSGAGEPNAGQLLKFDRYNGTFRFFGANSSGTTRIPLTIDIEHNAVVGVTPATSDNSTKIATTAYVKSNLSSKQDILVSGTNIKTINGNSVLGSGDLTVGGSWGSITGTLSNQTDLNNALSGKADVDLSNMNPTQTVKNTIVGWGMPDYTAGVSKSWNTNITATKNVRICYGGASQNQVGDSIRLYINNNLVGDYVIASAGVFMQWADIPAGAPYKVTGGQWGQYIIEYPFLGE